MLAAFAFVLGTIDAHAFMSQPAWVCGTALSEPSSQRLNLHSQQGYGYRPVNLW
jgi:hypothetical protein